MSATLCISSRLAARRCLYGGMRTRLGGIGSRVIAPASIQLHANSFSTTQAVQAFTPGKHWYTERLAAVSLLAIIPAGFIYPNPVVDYSLAVLIPLHGHWGYLSVVEDYLPDVLKGLGRVLVYLITAGAFSGLMYLNVKDGHSRAGGSLKVVQYLLTFCIYIGSQVGVATKFTTPN